MKKVTLGILGMCSACAFATARDGKPNVIVIYTDDMGTLDAGCYGAPDLFTPNIDALADEGVRFTQFYGAPVSSASRACLLSGKFGLRAGMTSNAGPAGIRLDCETLADRMRKNGYGTACIGKWHLGESYEHAPNQRGFDYFWGFLGGCIDSYSHHFYWGGPNKHDLWENNREIFRPGEFFAEASLGQVRNYIQTQPKDRPFFLYWAVNIPHYPLQPKQKWLDFYSHLDQPRRLYAAFLSTFDDLLGDLRQLLKAEGLDENTIIIFQSDNGHSYEIRTFGQGGWCGDYRGGKFSLFEGGIRVPAIITWPGHIPAGETRDQLAMNIDWFPTILDLCGLDAEGIDVDGKTLVPVIMKDKKSPHEILHYEFLDQWAVRWGDWKLIFNAKDVHPNDNTQILNGYYLTNLKKDRTESENLIEQYPDVFQKMLKIREDYVQSCNRK